MELRTLLLFCLLLIFFSVTTCTKLTEESTLQKNEDLKYKPGRAGYVTIDGVQYYIDDVIKRDWARSTSFCQGISMNLVAIETGQEDSAILTYLQENGMQSNLYWTSGSLIDGTWTWVNKNLAFDFTNWATGEPNSDAEEICMHLSDIGWVDDDCTAFHHYICQ